MANKYKAGDYMNSGKSKAEYLSGGKSSSSSKVLSSSQAKTAASPKVASSDSKSLQKAQKDYLSSLKPSKDESNAIKANQNLLLGQETQAKQIQNVQGDAGNNVASSFVSGQLGALDDKTQAASVPLKYQIAALQSARQAKSEVAGKKLGFVQSAITGKATAAHQSLVDANLQATIDKKLNPKGSGSGLRSVAQSNKDYTLRQTNDKQQGFVTLPKGMAGPPTPKLLIKKARKV